MLEPVITGLQRLFDDAGFVTSQFNQSLSGDRYRTILVGTSSVDVQVSVYYDKANLYAAIHGTDLRFNLATPDSIDKILTAVSQIIPNGHMA